MSQFPQPPFQPRPPHPQGGGAPPPPLPRPVTGYSVQPIDEPLMGEPIQPAAPQLSVRQWQSHVRRMVMRGENREQILYTMTAANWAYADAVALITRSASAERWKAIWMLVGGIALALFSAAVTFFSVTGGGEGVILYGPLIFGIGLAIYGIVRLAKIRA